VSEAALRHVGFPFELWEGEPAFYKPVGCAECGGDGYLGRIGLYELMPVTGQ